MLFIIRCLSNGNIAQIAFNYTDAFVLQWKHLVWVDSGEKVSHTILTEYWIYSIRIQVIYVFGPIFNHLSHFAKMRLFGTYDPSLKFIPRKQCSWSCGKNSIAEGWKCQRKLQAITKCVVRVLRIAELVVSGVANRISASMNRSKQKTTDVCAGFEVGAISRSKKLNE